MELTKSRLALFGGRPAIESVRPDLFAWPVYSPAMEKAVLEVMRSGNISGLDITRKFEEEFAAWIGTDLALAHNNGTAAIHCALYGLGIGVGDEVICPAVTYWASAVPVYSLGGRVVFADIDPDTLCIDPKDIERRITARTKAIMVVHYSGMPADMDAILAIARRHGIAVIEDASHSHGALYKGKMTGSFGEVAAFSLMSAKAFPIGEGGMLVTNDRRIYERAILFAHYARHSEALTIPELAAGAGIPWGGYKYRINQLASAIGREQLKEFPARMREIDEAMNYFWDLLEGVPGIHAHRPQKGSGSTKGGWYFPLGLYRGAELGGLSVTRFTEAVRAEGFTDCIPGCNTALHLHPLFTTIDIYGAGRPTQLANLASGEAGQGIPGLQAPPSLPVSEAIQRNVFRVPWFKKLDRESIEQHANAFRKVAAHYEELLEDDPGDGALSGQWGTSSFKR